MAKRKSANNLALQIIISLISFIIGVVAIYLIITKTNIIPINYTSKYFQIYDAAKTPDTDVYIDLARGFKFNYSPVYKLSMDTPVSLNTKSADYFTIQLSRGNSKININGFVPDVYGPGYEFRFKPNSSPTLLEYVKKGTATIYEPINNARKFTKTTISGKEAVVYEFEMTQEIFDALPDEVFGKGTMEPNKLKEEQKVGYGVKVVFFKNGNFVYTIGTDSLEDSARERAFDTVVNSFKFLY